MSRNVYSVFFETRFLCRDNWITLMSKSAKFRVIAGKCLGNPNKIEFRKKRYIHF
jgi:hypothetical protein